MKKTLKEFKEFISKGNVMDLAVAVIIGGAFTAIVTSLVNDILMPLIGVIIGGYDFSSLSVNIGSASIKYGMFIQNIINFIIIAICVFIMIKIIGIFIKKKEEVKEAKPSDEVLLLQEIRDLLKKNK